MLQYGQLVEFAGAVVEEPLHEGIVNDPSCLGDWVTDHFLALVACQHRHEKLVRGDQLGETGETRAFSDIIGAHGQHDVNIG